MEGKRQKFGCLVLCASTAFAQGVWETRAPYPVMVTEVAAAALNGKVYALCGVSPQNEFAGMFVYDPVADSWAPAAPFPNRPLDHCNVAAAGGKLYLLGAIRLGTPVVDGNTYEYDPAADRWSAVATMPTPRGASGVAAIGTKIYVAGGLTPDRSVAAFEVFDTVTRQWIRLPDMPTARDHLTAQAIGGKFYAIAGRTTELIAANEEYDPAANTWRARAPIPVGRGGIGSGTLRNRIQVFGGEGPSGRPEQTYQQNDEYDPATDTWHSLAPMLTPRHGLYGATLDGRIFTPAGGPIAGANFSNVHEAFYLPPEEPPRLDAALHAASFATLLAPGALVSLFGDRLSNGEQKTTRFPAPNSMNAVTVRVNGVAAPLLYVGPRQINFQLPYDLAVEPLSLTVSNAGSGSSALNVTSIVDAAPGIFTPSQTGTGQGAIVVASTGVIADAAHPAHKGEFVSLYGTGLGHVTATSPAMTVEKPVVTIGGAQAVVDFSGLTPGLTGVYQINVKVPQDAVTGASVPVVVAIGGRSSNPVTMAVVE